MITSCHIVILFPLYLLKLKHHKVQLIVIYIPLSCTFDCISKTSILFRKFLVWIIVSNIILISLPMKILNWNTVSKLKFEINCIHNLIQKKTYSIYIFVPDRRYLHFRPLHYINTSSNYTKNVKRDSVHSKIINLISVPIAIL